jgi:NADPH2:quinone reductase
VASVQLARALGHTVIALSRNPQKAARLEQLGAHRVFDPNDPEWRRRLTEALRGRRVDLAVDNVGGPLFPAVLETLGEHGRVSCVGRLAGPVPQFNTAWLFYRRLRIGGVAVGAYTPAEAREAWAGVLRLLDVTGARPLIDSVWEFGRLREAFDRLAPGPMGKVLLRVKG